MEDRKGDKCDPFAALSRTVGLTVFTRFKNQTRRRSEDGKYLLSTVMTILGKSLSRKT